MSKAPAVCPPNNKSISKCGMFATYTYWKPKKLKSGEIVYHSHSETRKLKLQNVSEKNKILKQLKRKLTHNPNLTVRDLEVFLDLIDNKPQTLKIMIQRHTVAPV